MVKPSSIFGRLGNQMFQMAYIYAQMRRGEIPDVYVQDPKYFDEFRLEIRQMFGQGITRNGFVGIHVRRGDYVNNGFYVDLMKTDYYQKAMAMFPNDKFKVYSDDIDWCRQQEIFKDCVFSTQKDEILDLNDLAGSKAIIMANSSYSWWAGYLSNGKVIYPSQWYTDGIQRTICPKEWIKI